MHHLRLSLSQFSVAISLIAGSLLSACGGGAGDSTSAESTAPDAVAFAGHPDKSIQSMFTADALAVATAEIATTDPALAATASAVLLDSQAASAPDAKALAVTAPISNGSVVNATGATYYVDSKVGNDSYTGTAEVPGALAAGPWRTLAKLNQTGFSPGDTIRLACGSIWNETLRLNSSGTAGNPITVTAASSNCAAAPTIDGSVAIPAASWVHHSGSIYRTALPRTSQTTNLITNGDFATSYLGWSVWSPKNDAVKLQVPTCETRACMNVTTVADNSLLISNSFPLKTAVDYTARLSLKAPTGTKVRVFVRRAVAPFDTVGYAKVISGSGAWQTITTPFVASATLSNARLDFEVPATGITVQIAAVSVVAPSSAVAPTLLEPMQLATTAGLLNTAHHPNRGYDSAQPSSVYLRTAANSDRVTVNGRIASTYLTIGSDLKVPVGATIPNGTTVRIRTNAWTIEEVKTNGYSGSRLSLATPSLYPITTGWGYYLLGQLWMLDSPGEWFYDKVSQTAYVWMPDGAAPAAPLLATYLPVGIESAGRQHTIFDGIAVRNVGVGANMRSTSGVVLRNARIENTAGAGVDASGGAGNLVDQNVISRTGGDAITAVDYILPTATGMQITNNRIDQSGVLVSGNTVLSLPTASGAAIRAGYKATVIGNTLRDTGYVGVWMLGQSSVRNNYISGACTVVDDCGAIYTSGSGNGSVIANNIIDRTHGSVNGKPAAAGLTQGQGIYLDDLTSGVTVEGNTVMFADYGIHMHNAANNLVQGNKLFGNRLAQLWMQEQTTRTRATGDIYGNTIRANQFVPTEATARGFQQQSAVSSTALFGSFDFNRYFDRIYQSVGIESSPSMTAATYTIGTWKSAIGPNGQPRLQDVNGRGASEQLFATYIVSGGNIVPNGNLAANANGWTKWNATAPIGTLSRQPCAPGYCAVYTAGGSDGILSTPNFTVVQGQWYRMSVDVMTAADGQNLSMIVRRGGGGANSYEDLGSGYKQQIAGREWKRVSFIFRASKTVNANDAVTGDLGARLDFQSIKPGQQVTVSNVELVPITTGETLTAVDILVNASATAVQMACPAAALKPTACAIYARLTDDTAISWPYLLPALSTEIIYTRDGRLADADGDGIADTEDKCPSTAVGVTVSADGCSFLQRH